MHGWSWCTWIIKNNSYEIWPTLLNCQFVISYYWLNNMRIRGVLQLGLQLNFWVAMTICNSLYFYTHECYRTSCILNCKRYNSLYILWHSNAIHYNSIVIQLQLLFNYYATLLNDLIVVSIFWMDLWFHDLIRIYCYNFLNTKETKIK
jgi:hypothetical protein